MSTSLLDASNLISQGAEAKLYRAVLHGSPVLLKHRFSKTYRHPTLDASLTRSRLAGEARALLKCLRSGVNVPAIRMVDAPEGVLGLEWIEGRSVRQLLPLDGIDAGAKEADIVESFLEFGISQNTLMHLIGVQIAKMHQADIIHGDLTTSNMMLRRPASDDSKHSPELVLIDFGLSYHSSLAEDKAVDLYVLERAFLSTHPDASALFRSVLRSYEVEMGTAWTDVARKLDDVRMRGRKRSMVG